MKKAFTLIELLIVVAIIAILAAIAVPNFLSAQVRAKVSRAKADMRTITNALEQYTLEWNRPLMDRPEWEEAIGQPITGVSDKFEYSKLTCPVPYISSIPPDPFTTVAAQTPLGNQRTRAYYGYKVPIKGNSKAHDACIAQGFTWVLYSFGPTKTNLQPESPTTSVNPLKILVGGAQGGINPCPLYIYDGSNGTVSFGFLIRTNKGEFTGANRQEI